LSFCTVGLAFWRIEWYKREEIYLHEGGGDMSRNSGPNVFQRGVMALILLSLLRREDMYGYQLVQEIERCSGGQLKTQEGSLYPVLYRLQEQGLISDRPVVGGKREAEAGEILRAVRGYVVALAVEGEKISSEGLASRLKRLGDEGREITFVIGSSCGLSERVKSAADWKLSFSDMTFPHQLMRVILAEQVYRAFMINSGSAYHK